MKLRSRPGRALIAWPPKVVETSARSVFRSSPGASTISVSVMGPGCSTSSTRVSVSRETLIDGAFAVLKPARTAATPYTPGSNRSLRKKPEGSETAASAVFRSTLAIVMITSGTVAPDESVTVPAMLPYTAWAVAGADGTSKARSVNHATPQWCVTTGNPRGAARAD